MVIVEFYTFATTFSSFVVRINGDGECVHPRSITQSLCERQRDHCYKCHLHIVYITRNPMSFRQPE